MKILIFSLSILTSISLFASPLDLKSLKKDDLKKICSKVCGKDYASNAEIRDFYQLKKSTTHLFLYKERKKGKVIFIRF
jgi:hypothetical protein